LTAQSGAWPAKIPLPETRSEKATWKAAAKSAPEEMPEMVTGPEMERRGRGEGLEEEEVTGAMSARAAAAVRRMRAMAGAWGVV
jgi:hypothetical protein